MRVSHITVRMLVLIILLIVVAGCGHGDPEVCRLVVQRAEVPFTIELLGTWDFSDMYDLDNSVIRDGLSGKCVKLYANDETDNRLISAVLIYESEGQAQAALKSIMAPRLAGTVEWERSSVPGLGDESYLLQSSSSVGVWTFYYYVLFWRQGNKVAEISMDEEQHFADDIEAVARKVQARLE